MEEPRDHLRFKVLKKKALLHNPHPVLRGIPGSTDWNTFDLRPPAVTLEVEDQSFHHNSAVMMPALKSDFPPFDGEPEGGTDLLRELEPVYPDWYEEFTNWHIPEAVLRRFEYHRRGLAVLAVCYLFLEQYPRYRLLLAGHTDTSGGEDYNFSLSDLRAENVDCLLQGKRDRWVGIVKEKCKVEDIQLICAYLNHTRSWSCDPGPIDGAFCAQTEAAIRGLQQAYNDRFGKNIAIDGQAGSETWGAIYDIYMAELASLLDIEVEELPDYRARLKYVDDNYHRIGCGECIPIDEAARDNYRSAENRRVEFLFFDEDYLPDLSAHLAGGKIRSGDGGREVSGIYAPGAYRFVYLDPEWWTGGDLPPPKTDQPRPRVETIEESVDHLPFPPNSDDVGLELYDPTEEEAIEEGLHLETEDEN